MGTLNSWDVVDGGNNAAPPDGWPENTMQYSEVNNTGRAVQGTLKRWFADNNGTLVGGGVADAYTVTLNETGYTAYFVGMTFRCSIPADNLTTTPTIDVNGIGVVTITDNEGFPISVSNFVTGGIYDFQYDGVNMRVGGGALGASSASGNDTEMQYNDNGLLGGTGEFTYNSSDGQLIVTNATITTQPPFAIVANGLTSAFGLDISSGGASMTGGGAIRAQVTGGAGIGSVITAVSGQSAGGAILATANNPGTRSIYAFSSSASRTVPLIFVENDDPTGSGVGMEIQNDPAGAHIDLTGDNGLGIHMIGGVLLTERADHANTPVAGRGELWVRDDTLGSRLFFTDDNAVDYDLVSFSGGNQPTGTIIAWPGATPPGGFLECDGSSVLVATYPDLFAVIGYDYGGSGANFNLPDYRGEFLRGIDQGRGADPDAGSRTNRGDGTTGDNVGTFQNHEFESHQHSDIGVQLGDADGSPLGQGWLGTHFTGFAGGNETRPRNVYVMYCIRFESQNTSGTAVGPDMSVQFNTTNTFDGDAEFIWNTTTKTLTVQGNTNLRSAGAGDPTLGDPITNFLDFESSDPNLYAQIGFNADNELQFRSEVWAGEIRFYSQDAVGVEGSILTLKADEAAVEFLDDFNTPVTIEGNTGSFLGGGNGVLLISNGATQYFEEIAAAQADVAGFGQLWVRNDVPNVLVFTDDAGTDTVLGAGGVPGGADTNIQFNNAGAFGGDAELFFTGGGTASPTLTLGDGTARFPAFVINYDAADDGSIEFQEDGAVRGGVSYYASIAGNTDVLRLENKVNGGAATNSVTEITAENLVQISCNEEGTRITRTLRLDERPDHDFTPALGFGQIWVSNVDNNLYFTDEAGTDFQLNGAGGGNVSNTGTPVDNQLAVWTAATTIEGTTALEFDSATASLTVGDGVIANPEVNIDGPAAGDAYLNFNQNGTLRGRVWFDDTNNTLRLENAGDNNILLTTNGLTRLTANATGIVSAGDIEATGDIIVPQSQQLFLDGGSDTYISSTAANEIDFVCNSVTPVTITENRLEIVRGFSENENTFTGAAGTKNLNTEAATVFSASTSMAGNAITFTFDNPSAAGAANTITLILNAASTATLTWPASVDWPGGTEPTWSTGIDVVSFVTKDGGTTWYGFLGGLNFS